MPGEARFGVPGHGDNRYIKPFDRWQDARELFGLAGITQCQHAIAVVDHAEVAMQGIHQVQEHAGCAGAGQSGGDFMADVSRLADAGDDDLAPVVEAFDDGLHGFGEIGVETSARLAQAVDLNVKYSFGKLDVTHESTKGARIVDAPAFGKGARSKDNLAIIAGNGQTYLAGIPQQFLSNMRQDNAPRTKLVGMANDLPIAEMTRGVGGVIGGFD
jgi:hypothetical protein